MKNIAENRTNNSLLVTLMLTIVIDVMGFGLVFPLIPSLFVTGHAVLIDGHSSMAMRHLFYGLALALWPVGAFFGTPYFGGMSDKFGRKRVLSICLLMTGMTYAFSAVAIYFHLATLFFLSRLLSGFFGGNYDIAQAAAADISLPELKVRNMGWITLAASFGFIIGPAITGFTFGPITPFLIACGLALLNTVMIQVLFKETYEVKKAEHVSFIKSFSSFLFIFTDRRVMRLGLIFFLLNIGWGFYVTAMPLILQQHFHFTVQLTGLFFCVLGVGCAFTILFIQPKVIAKISLKRLYIVTTLLIAVLLFVSDLYPTLKELWIAVGIFAVLEILCYSGLLAMSSNAVTEDEQGMIMGGLGASGSLSMFVTGALLAWLTNFNVFLPILIAAVTYLLSAILMLGFKKSHKRI